MNWSTVRLPGCRLVYLPAGEEVEFERVAAVSASANLRRMDASLVSHPRARRVLWRLSEPEWKPGPPGWEKKAKKGFGFLYAVLHWSDGTDLGELDGLVLGSRVGPEDFAGCLAVEPRSIRCLECGAVVDVLVAHVGDGPPGLATRERVDRHRYHRRCPSCGQGSRWPLVVEFLDQDTRPPDRHVRADPA